MPPSLPSLKAPSWLTEFRSEGAGTAITVEITFDSETDLEKIVAGGFKEGFTMALGNLDEFLGQTQF